jgi:hypothetical protein
MSRNETVGCRKFRSAHPAMETGVKRASQIAPNFIFYEYLTPEVNKAYNDGPTGPPRSPRSALGEAVRRLRAPPFGGTVSEFARTHRQLSRIP